MLDSVLDTLKQVLKRFLPLSFEELFALGLEKYEEQAYEESLAIFLRLQKKQPNSCPVYYNLGKLYETMNDKGNAELAYKTALDVDADDYDSLYNLGRFYYENSRAEDALPILKHANEVLNVFLGEEPAEEGTPLGDPDLYLVMGYVCDELNETDDAIVYYEKVLEHETSVAIRIFLTKLYLQKQDAEGALRHIPSPSEVDPLDIELNYDLSLCLAKLNRWDDTVTCCERVIDVDPKYTKAYNQLGLANYCMNKYTEAVINYETALALDPQYATALNNLAYTFEKMEAYDKAIERFTQYMPFIETNPREKIEVKQHIEVLKQKLEAQNPNAQVSASEPETEPEAETEVEVTPESSVLETEIAVEAEPAAPTPTPTIKRKLARSPNAAKLDTEQTQNSTEDAPNPLETDMGQTEASTEPQTPAESTA